MPDSIQTYVLSPCKSHNVFARMGNNVSKTTRTLLVLTTSLLSLLLVTMMEATGGLEAAVASSLQAKGFDIVTNGAIVALPQLGWKKMDETFW